MGKKKFRLVIYTLLIMLSLTFFMFSFVLLKEGYSNKTIYLLNYKETNKMDYLVYLKENNFFKDKYLAKGRSYITSLIDYISTNVYYNVKFDDLVSGKYSYTIKATVYANKTDGSGSYWSKEFEIKNVQDTSINNTDGFSILENIAVDYDEYNAVYASFKNNASMKNVAMDGELKIELSVKADITGDGIEDKTISSSNVMSIPLSQSAIDVSINTDDSEVSKILTNQFTDGNIKFLIYKILGYVCLVAGFAFIFAMFRMMNLVRKSHVFDYNLKKILNNYDSIIVNVSGKFDTKGVNTIYVNSFSELLDAHSEVRMPINYYNIIPDEEAWFVLINENNAWVYVMNVKTLKGKL